MTDRGCVLLLVTWAVVLLHLTYLGSLLRQANQSLDHIHRELHDWNRLREGEVWQRPDHPPIPGTTEVHTTAADKDGYYKMRYVPVPEVIE